MLLVEGHLELLKMFSEMSKVSHSIASDIFREYIGALEKAAAMGYTVTLPRTIDSTPMVGEDGKVSPHWINPEAGSGRIVSKSS